MTNPPKLLSPIQCNQENKHSQKQNNLKNHQTQIITAKTPPSSFHETFTTTCPPLSTSSSDIIPTPENAQILQQHGNPPPHRTSQNDSSKATPPTSWPSPTTHISSLINHQSSKNQFQQYCHHKILQQHHIFLNLIS